MSGRLRVAFGAGDAVGDPFRRALVGFKDSAAGHAALVEGEELAAIDALARDLSVTSVVCQGAVGPSLIRIAADQPCDAIAIGAGRRQWRPWAGPVERYLRHHAAVPVIAASCANPGSRSRGARAGRLRATVDRDSVGRFRDVASNSNLSEPPEVTT